MDNRFVSISQSRCLSFQDKQQHPAMLHTIVSISQSRCLSFQVAEPCRHASIDIRFQSRNRDACHFRVEALDLAVERDYLSFNLAIEMLVISGWRSQTEEQRLHYRFNLAIEMLVISGIDSACWPARQFQSFNLAIEMLVISGCAPQRRLPPVCFQKFQSRNRDACHFRAAALGAQRRRIKFQSRNRDACHFRASGYPYVSAVGQDSFNLAIEMLVISGSGCYECVGSAFVSFQSRNRDACHFRAGPIPARDCRPRFQSRNRDACHFRVMR